MNPRHGTITVINGGILTTGFSEKRGRQKNLSRRFTSCDTAVKNTSNPEWRRLPPLARLAHDELERWAGNRVCGGRLVGARTFNKDDWHAVALTTRATVERLVRAGWAEWEGADLVLLGTDLAGETGYVNRIVSKKAAGWFSRNRSIRSDSELPSAEVGQKTPCQMAETSHFRDRAPAPAPLRSDLGALPIQPKAKNPPPPPPDPRVKGGGGGGSKKPTGQTEPGPESFEVWWALWDKPEGKASALAEWNALAMLPAGVNACMEFTRRELGNARNTRDGGRFKTRGDKFLLERWKPKLSEFRKKAARKNGHEGPETSETILAAYMGGEA